MPRYSLAELEALPTLLSGHFDNLKIQTVDERVWLSRLTVADGVDYDNQVLVEKKGPWGDWEITETYQCT